MTQNSNGGHELQRGIKGWQVTFIGLGGVIGSCYFLGIGVCVRTMGPAVLLGFALVSIVIYAVMVAYAELLVNVPRTGSFISYTKEFLGPQWSIGMGWAFWCNWVAFVPAECIALASTVKYMTGSDSLVLYAGVAIGALAVVTIINIAAVSLFSKIEGVLGITKVSVIILFIIVGLGIWLGLWGNHGGFVGASVNFSNMGSLTDALFPKGSLIVFTQMTLILVTCEGTELIGLAAAEAQNPEESVPKACKSVIWRVLGLYLVPIVLILLVYPWGNAQDEVPIFADICNSYGMPILGFIMSAAVFVAAFSCSNSGFYGSVRGMYGLATEGLAPKFLKKVTPNGNPRNCVWLTMGCMWVIMILGLVSQLTGALETLYASLLSLAGFTGTMCWIGICLSQYMMRRKLKQRGYDPKTCLKARVSDKLSWLPLVAALIQIVVLVMLVIEDQLVFSIAAACTIVPMVIRYINVKRGKAEDSVALSSHEKSFDELFPPLRDAAVEKQHHHMTVGELMEEIKHSEIVEEIRHSELVEELKHMEKQPEVGLD